MDASVLKISSLKSNKFERQLALLFSVAVFSAKMGVSAWCDHWNHERIELWGTIERRWFDFWLMGWKGYTPQ